MGASAWDMTSVAPFPHASTEVARDAGMPGMAMPASSVSPSWSLGVWLTAVAMWSAMMVAMMTPSAAPTILLYARVHRGAARGGLGSVAPTNAFAAGYLMVWLFFSIAAAGLQWALQDMGLVSATKMGSHSKGLSAAVMIAAGLYQFTTVHSLCLRHCRAPAAFLARHWRPGSGGAARLGVIHGTYCVGCCWVLMVLLFVGGVMNLAWIAALTLLVLAQRLAPGGVWVGRAAGAVLIAWGVATLMI